MGSSCTYSTRTGTYQFLKHLIDFHETLYERYATGEYCSAEHSYGSAIGSNLMDSETCQAKAPLSGTDLRILNCLW
jgi:hypothetical protein